MIIRNPLPIEKSRILMVVPCFNEEKRFDQEYFDHLTRIESTAWLFVDDGSKDATLSVLSNFCRRSNTNFLHLPKNVGKSEALRIGMLQAIEKDSGAKWIGFLDSDGAFSVEDVNEILTKIMKAIGIIITNKKAIAQHANEIRGALEVLGCDPFDPNFASAGGEDLTNALDGVIQLALAQRTAARERKDFASSDQIRDGLAALGITIEDTAQGPRWSISQISEK